MLSSDSLNTIKESPADCAAATYWATVPVPSLNSVRAPSMPAHPLGRLRKLQFIPIKIPGKLHGSNRAGLEGAELMIVT